MKRRFKSDLFIFAFSIILFWGPKNAAQAEEFNIAAFNRFSSRPNGAGITDTRLNSI